MLKHETIETAVFYLEEKAARLHVAVKVCDSLGSDAPRDARRDKREWESIKAALLDLKILGQVLDSLSRDESPKIIEEMA